MTKLCEYDIWFKPCDRCGYDPGKKEDGNTDNYTTIFGRCWKCGNTVRRDFSERALKKDTK